MFIRLLTNGDGHAIQNRRCNMNGELTGGPRSPRITEAEEIYHKICVVPRSAPKPKTVCVLCFSNKFYQFKLLNCRVVGHTKIRAQVESLGNINLISKG